GRLDRHVAKAAEADLGDAAPGFDPANGTHAAINTAFAKRPARHIDAQGVGVIDEGFDERLNLGVDARPIRSARFDDLFSFVHLLPPSSKKPDRTLTIRSPTKRLAHPLVLARAHTVHIGRFLSIHSEDLGRSVTQSGHFKRGGRAIPLLA